MKKLVESSNSVRVLLMAIKSEFEVSYAIKISCDVIVSWKIRMNY